MRNKIASFCLGLHSFLAGLFVLGALSKIMGALGELVGIILGPGIILLFITLGVYLAIDNHKSIEKSKE